MSASPESDNDILHQDHDALVTPSWLTVAGTSYAIRTMTRLDYRAYKPPTSLATLVFCCALVLMGVCLWYLFGGIVPVLLAWGLLIASTTLMLYSAWYAFAVKPHYQVLVTLLNGSFVRIKRHRRQDAEGLHRGLTEAMDWHIGGEIIISADRSEALSTPRNSPFWEPQGSNEPVVPKLSDNRKARQAIPFLSLLHHKRRD